MKPTVRPRRRNAQLETNYTVFSSLNDFAGGMFAFSTKRFSCPSEIERRIGNRPQFRATMRSSATTKGTRTSQASVIAFNLTLHFSIRRLYFDNSNTIPRRTAVYHCCPGWSKVSHNSHGCNKRKCFLYFDCSYSINEFDLINGNFHCSLSPFTKLTSVREPNSNL